MALAPQTKTQPKEDPAKNRPVIDEESWSWHTAAPAPATDEEGEFPEDFPDYYPNEFNNYLAQQEAATILQRRENTRGILAILYTIATFIMFLLGFVVAILDAQWRQVSIVETLTNILPLISGIFLGTLGFVLGYYFRQTEEEDRDRYK